MCTHPGNRVAVSDIVNESVRKTHNITQRPRTCVKTCKLEKPRTINEIMQKTLTPELSVEDTEETLWYRFRFDNGTVAYAYNLIVRNTTFSLSMGNTKFLLLRHI